MRCWLGSLDAIVCPEAENVCCLLGSSATSVDSGRWRTVAGTRLSSSGFWARLFGSTQKSLPIVASTFQEAHSELPIVPFAMDGVGSKSLQEDDVHTYSLRHLPFPPAQNYPRSVLKLASPAAPQLLSGFQSSRGSLYSWSEISNRSPAPY
jgi:hypothetical protein